MTFIIFLIVLGILVFVHELGHFLVAKKAGVRVDEFGFGYPPRAKILFKKWGTVFTLNWIPFGGFVKIVGEDYEEDNKTSLPAPPLLGKERGALQDLEFQQNKKGDEDGKSFINISKRWQALILAAGVTFNILFAWFLFTFGFLIGMPTSVDNNLNLPVKNPALTIISVLPDSPAKTAGLKAGDKIKSISNNVGATVQNLDQEKASDFINKSSGEISISVNRGSEVLDFKILPKTGIVDNKKIIGIGMDMVGTLSLPLHKAIYEGGKTTLEISKATIAGIYGLIRDALKAKADISQVAGPVGIIGLVGDASRLGFTYLIIFTALISINLAIINLVPFPALDGGRILFVAIEGITKKKINHRIASALNTIGFAILIALMLIVTYRDILRLF